MRKRRGYEGRFIFCGIFLGLAMCGLGVRLGFLHVGPHDTALAAIHQNRKWTRELQVERGKIFDRRGEENILALDLPVHDVCADPDTVVSSGQVVNVATELSALLGLPADELAVKLNRPGRHYSCLAQSLQEEDMLRVSERRLPGVFFQERTVRYYPHHEFLCHVLGFVNHEGFGSAGVEQRLDRFLRGCPGLLESEKNAFREEMYWKRGRYVAPLEGASVYLTIDQNVQYIVEKALDHIGQGSEERLRWKGAWAIVQEVRTGEILAMASRPAYDLNSFRDAADLQKLNSAVGYVYEPGSTLKAITFAAALDEGLVTPDTVIDCENGSWMHRNRVLHDYKPSGRLTVADGLKKSSNILTAKLSVMLGDERLYEYLHAFGLGQKLGIDLPGEEGGILRPLNEWSPISASRMAIGQGVAVTALQMAAIYAAIGNDGVMMRPYLVRKVVATDGTVLHERRPEEIGSPITAKTAKTMQRLLARVTEKDGTGKRAHVDGYAVAGKTGTAQKPIPGGYSTTDHIASFVGFLPADDPRIAIVVVVDEPQPIHTGGLVAAPVFQAIASEAARYLDLPATEETAIAKR